MIVYAAAAAAVECLISLHCAFFIEGNEKGGPSRERREVPLWPSVQAELECTQAIVQQLF